MAELIKLGLIINDRNNDANNVDQNSNATGFTKLLREHPTFKDTPRYEFATIAIQLYRQLLDYGLVSCGRKVGVFPEEQVNLKACLFLQK